MAEDSIAVVHLGSGMRGRADHASLRRANGVVVVTLEDGRTVEAPASAFERRGEGEYVLPITLEKSAGNTETVIPVIEEYLDVSRRTVGAARVRIQKTVHRRQETVDEPLFREEVRVKRVPVDASSNASTEVRQQGDTLIVPVVEEVLVVTRATRVREELHITRERVEFREPVTMELRREEVTVDRTEQPRSHQGSTKPSNRQPTT